MVAIFGALIPVVILKLLVVCGRYFIIFSGFGGHFTAIERLSTTEMPYLGSKILCFSASREFRHQLVYTTLYLQMKR